MRANACCETLGFGLVCWWVRLRMCTCDVMDGVVAGAVAGVVDGVADVML